MWAEVENGQLAPVSIELLGKAVELSENLAQPVEAVLIGNGVSGWQTTLLRMVPTVCMWLTRR